MPTLSPTAEKPGFSLLLCNLLSRISIAVIIIALLWTALFKMIG